MTTAHPAPAHGDPSVQTVDQVLQALGADAERGLTSQEAARRLAESGRNALRGAPAVATWRRANESPAPSATLTSSTPSGASSAAAAR